MSIILTTHMIRYGDTDNRNEPLVSRLVVKWMSSSALLSVLVSMNKCCIYGGNVFVLQRRLSVIGTTPTAWFPLLDGSQSNVSLESCHSFHSISGQLLRSFATIIIKHFVCSHDWELPRKSSPKGLKLKRGVRDMLVTHHLFSWNT